MRPRVNLRAASANSAAARFSARAPSVSSWLTKFAENACARTFTCGLCALHGRWLVRAGVCSSALASRLRSCQNACGCVNFRAASASSAAPRPSARASSSSSQFTKVTARAFARKFTRGLSRGRSRIRAGAFPSSHFFTTKLKIIRTRVNLHAAYAKSAAGRSSRGCRVICPRSLTFTQIPSRVCLRWPLATSMDSCFSGRLSCHPVPLQDVGGMYARAYFTGGPPRTPLPFPFPRGRLLSAQGVRA